MKITVLKNLEYPITMNDYLEVETDEITDYSVKMTHIKTVNGENKCRLDKERTQLRLAAGFSNEESALNWLKDNNIEWKLTKVCLLSFTYKSKKYTSIYVPGIEDKEKLDMYELIVGKSLFNKHQVYINTKSISPTESKSFLNLFIEAKFTTKEHIESMFLYGTMGESDNDKEFSIEIPVDDCKSASVTNQKIIIRQSDVHAIQVETKKIHAINLEDRPALDASMSIYNLFGKTQKEIIDLISESELVSEIKLVRLTLITENYNTQLVAYNPNNCNSKYNKGVKLWVYLNGYNIEYKGITEYNKTFNDIYEMYKIINGFDKLGINEEILSHSIENDKVTVIKDELLKEGFSDFISKYKGNQLREKLEDAISKKDIMLIDRETIYLKTLNTVHVASKYDLPDDKEYRIIDMNPGWGSVVVKHGINNNCDNYNKFKTIIPFLK